MESGHGILTVPEILSSFYGVNNNYRAALSFLKGKVGVMFDGNFIPDLETIEETEFKSWLKDEYDRPFKREFLVDFEYKNIQIFIPAKSTNYLFLPYDKNSDDMLKIFNDLLEKHS